MKKTYLIFVILLSLACSSCLTHFFSQPQPVDAKQMSTMPKPIIGQWYKANEVHTISADVWVSETIDSLSNTILKTEYHLSDSLILKRSGKHYFINNLEENGHWTLYLGIKSNNKFLIKSLGDDDTLTLKKSLNITPDSTANEKELYYNSGLTKRQLKRFVKDGGFSDTLIVFNLKTRIIEN
jgi:hypothetical protein